MALPTTFVPTRVNYQVVVEGSPIWGYNFSPSGETIEVILDQYGDPDDTATEAVMAIVEANLQYVADQYAGVTGVTSVKIYRSFQGSFSDGDIRS